MLANLSLTKPDASFEDICAAAEVACAHDFIQEMPSGYSSSVGERGSGLRGAASTIALRAGFEASSPSDSR